MKYYCLIPFLLSVHTYADERFNSTIILSDLKQPWAVTQGPNETLFITEKSGNIIKVKDGKKIGELSGIPQAISVTGQGGLLDIEFDPDYSINKRVFLTYTTKENAKPTNGLNTRVSSFVLQDNKLEDEKVLVQGGQGTDGAHFGSRIAFDSKKRMYVTFGERHNKEKAQDLRFLNGKIIRINTDGSIPDDNPFIGKTDARPEIFTYGHRNPQGIDIHPKYDVPVISEHGPTYYDANISGKSYGNADEVNWLVPGCNYGWPIIFGDPKVISWSDEMFSFLESAQAKMPVVEFTKPDGIAPSGVTFYTKEKFPDWKNQLFVASLRGYIVRIKMDDNGNLVESEKLLESDFGRIRDIEESHDGYLYIISDQGQLVKLEPSTK